MTSRILPVVILFGEIPENMEMGLLQRLRNQGIRAICQPGNLDAFLEELEQLQGQLDSSGQVNANPIMSSLHGLALGDIVAMAWLRKDGPIEVKLPQNIRQFEIGEGSITELIASRT